ncbi:MAG: ATP-dependent helicase [Anaerolineaceae bacterium]|nr:ATP-dependent helicase [Anaerolineaceae bacterium]
MTQSLSPLLRPAQYEVLSYRSGKMAILGVPGSGKTTTLAHLAANLLDKRLSKRDFQRDREILVVTLTNAAVLSFEKKFLDSLRMRGINPDGGGYRIRTLHGLSHDIVREKSSMLALPDNFFILDSQAHTRIIRHLVKESLRNDDIWVDDYLDHTTRRKVSPKTWWQHATTLSIRFIHHCKDQMLSPGDLMAEIGETAPALLRFNVRVYADYQRALMYQGAVDFDDLVMYALSYLRENPQDASRLIDRWPYILEDEAQDSSAIQEQLLRVLSSKSGNWVRAGDLNQAIYSSFTTANPVYLSQFINETDVVAVRLEQSGRFGYPIADVANALQRWTVDYHPTPQVRSAFDSLQIESVLPGDIQRIPPLDQMAIHIHYAPGVLVSPNEELRLVVQSLERWLPDNYDKTVAILVPDNARGFPVVKALQPRGIPYEELLRSTTSARMIVNTLCITLEYLAYPGDSARLRRLYYEVFCVLGRLNETDMIRRLGQYISHKMPEMLFYPADMTDSADDMPSDLSVVLFQFREFVRLCFETLSYPIEGMIVVLGRILFHDPVNIDFCYHLGRVLSSVATTNDLSDLPQLVDELRVIGQQQRDFFAMRNLRVGYAPRPGVVTVSTMHMAKGLEWDRVYVLGVNDLAFPSPGSGKLNPGSRWYIRDGLDLEAELIAQLQGVLAGNYVEGDATESAYMDYVMERLRLLYVAFTRARQAMIVLWSAPNTHGAVGPALPLQLLWEYLSGVFSFK